MKKKKRSHEEVNQLLTEILILQLLSYHDSIISIYDICDTKKRLYCIQQLCDGGDIIEWIIHRKKCNKKFIVNAIKQITDGLAHLHSFGYVHGNLCPQNILFETKDSELSLIFFINNFANYEWFEQCHHTYLNS